MATNKLIIQDVNGKVGIGTTSPSGRLTIQRSATAANTDITFKNEVGEDRSRIRFGGTIEELSFWTRSGGDITEHLRITAGGNVGIGTTNPSAKLEINGSIRFSGITESGGLGGRLWVPGQAIGGVSNAGLYALALTYLAKYDSGWKSVGGGTASAITIDEGRFSFTNSLGVGAGDSALTWTTRLMVDTNGNVGIGTTNPATTLHVDASSGGIVRVSRIGTGAGILQLEADGTDGTITTTNNMKFVTSGEEQMRLDTSGNLFLNAFSGRGGGSTGYLFKLNPGKVYFELMANNTTSQSDILFTDGASGAYGIVGYDHSNDSLRFYTNNGWNMTVDSQGKVGIGITEPSTKLHVRNDIVTADTTTSGNLTGFYAKWHAADTGIRISYLPDSAECFIDSTYLVTPGYVYGDINFRQNVAGTLTSRLYIKADGGNVGIGTTSPNIKLQVVSGTGAAYSATASKSSNMFGISVVGTANENTMQGIWFASGSNAGTHWSGIAGSRQQYTTDWSTKLVFYTHDENSLNLDQATEKMVITGGGSVGIGTPTPGTLHKLAVQGPGRIKRLQKQIYNWYTTAGNSYVHVKTNLLLVSGQVGMWVWRLYGYSYGGAKIVDAYYGLHSDGSGNIYSGAIQNQGNIAFGTNMYKSTDNYLVLVGLMDSTYFFGFDVDVHHTMDYGYSDLSIISITQSASSTGAF